VFTIPFPLVWYSCSFSQIFASRWLDTLQTWLKLSSHWFDYLKELPGIYFWVRCFQFHTHAFQLLLFINSKHSLYLSLQFLISVLIFAFCFPLLPDCCKSLIRYPFRFLLRLDASNRFSSYFQQNCLGTFPEIFWGYLICNMPLKSAVIQFLCRILQWAVGLTLQ